MYEAFLDRLKTGTGFLVSGHRDPDADCIATMLGVALLARKVHKPATLLIGGSIPENLQYLLTIAEYNRIAINTIPVASTDTLILCDTAKPSLLPEDSILARALENPEVQVFEIDHHLGGDSAYLAPPEQALVDHASSSGSLLARLVCKIDTAEAIEDVYSRNLVIALLTAMMSDTQMGRVLPSRREARIYHRLIGMLGGVLERSTFTPDKFDSIETLYAEMVRLSKDEEQLDNAFISRHHLDGVLAWIALDQAESTRLLREYGEDNVKAAARRVTDRMTGISGKIGMVCYFDDRGLIQCRMRREYGYEGIDLREVIPIAGAPDGGGHPGAIGFRYPQEQVPDFDDLVRRLISVAASLAA